MVRDLAPPDRSASTILGPLVHGFFALATEANDDDGCPHTLEHLVFLGSEDYPFKGVLDRVANRSLAQGTNAWTDTDHTCYTVRISMSDARSPPPCRSRRCRGPPPC